MKIDRKKFTDAIEYIRQVNETPFDSLDFSEFFDTDSHEFQECAREFKYFGLSNKRSEERRVGKECRIG